MFSCIACIEILGTLDGLTITPYLTFIQINLLSAYE